MQFKSCHAIKRFMKHTFSNILRNLHNMKSYNKFINVRGNTHFCRFRCRFAPKRTHTQKHATILCRLSAVGVLYVAEMGN